MSAYQSIAQVATYENILTVLVSASAVLMATLGALMAWRYRMRDDWGSMIEMRDVLDAQTKMIEHQTAAVLSTIEPALTVPSNLDIEKQLLMLNLTKQMEQTLLEVISNSTNIKNKDRWGVRVSEAFDGNFVAAANALVSVQKLHENIARLLDVKRQHSEL